MLRGQQFDIRGICIMWLKVNRVKKKEKVNSIL